MNAKPVQRDAAVRRILVALNAVSDSQAAIERAAAMAAEHEAELAGLFVEDLDLLHLCELPGFEVMLSSGTTRRTDRGEMERQLRARAAAAREALERIAAAHHLRWSFEVRRTRMLKAVREAAELADVVAADMAGPGRVSGWPVRPMHRGVLAYYEGGASSARVLALAVRAAVQQGMPLSVLVPVDDAAAAGEAATRVRALLRHHEVELTIERVQPGAAALQRRLRGGGAPLLFMEAAGRLVASGALPALAAAPGCEVVLVSGGPQRPTAGEPD